MGEEAVDVARQALMQALVIAVPILGAGLLVGLTISLFLKFIEKTGMLPYVIYRLLLGTFLLYLFF